MKFSKRRIASVSVLCIVLAPFAVAEEIQVAKVYRDYPGYLQSPTCANPRVAPVKNNQPALKNQTTDLLAAEDSAPAHRARKVYRNYPGYMQTPTCVNPRMNPSSEEQIAKEKNSVTPEAERVSPERIAAEKLTAEQVAARKAEEARVAAEQAENERLEAERLATQKADEEKLAAERAEAARVQTMKPMAREAGEIETAVESTVATKVEVQATAAQETEAVANVATELSDIQITPGKVVVESNGLIENYQYFSLTDPPRLVVDIYNLTHSLDTETYLAEDGFDKVRVGRHEHKTRVVFEAPGVSLPESTVEVQETSIVVSWVSSADGLATETGTADKAVNVVEAQPEPVAMQDIEELQKQEALAAQQAEADRVAAQQAEADRVAAQQAEADRVAAQQAEADRVAAQQAEADRIAAQQAEADRIAAQKAEADRIAAQKAEADRIAAQKAEADRIAAQKAEADRVAAQKAEADRKAKEDLQMQQLAKQQAEQLKAEQVSANHQLAQIPENQSVAADSEFQEQLEIRLSPHFPSFVATLQETDLAMLGYLVEQLKSQKLARIEVVGHSDNLPIAARSRHIFADNHALSKARASSVAEYLKKHLDVPAESISLRGLADSMPKADNSTDAGRALNRRVEVSLVTEPVEAPARMELVKDISAESGIFVTSASPHN